MSKCLLINTNRLRLSRLCVVICLVAIGLLPTSLVRGGQNIVRVRIDTKALTLTVIQNDRDVLSFSNIAIGRYGTATAFDKRRGDNKTPLGHFAIAWITGNTSFRRFFGLYYPNKEYAERAFQAGRLDKKTWDHVRSALAAGRLPPQDTVLGGNLGIHGIGDGDTAIHEQFNWTGGCVALTNDQIDRLAVWVRVGTPVEIR